MIRLARRAVHLGLSVMLGIGPAFAGEMRHAVPPAVVAELDARMRASRVAGAALARVADGELAWVLVNGERAPGHAVTEDTVFNAASLTKPLFATLVLHQVAEGRLGLDDPLARDWVDPDVARDPRRLALTARLALSHQGGFANWRGREPLRFMFEPGSRHEYSGEGYEYVRRALEKRSARTLRELARDSVVLPAGMLASSLGWDAAHATRIAAGFDGQGRVHPGLDFEHRAPNAAANLFTTIRDYGRFTAWVARGAALPDALRREMQRPQARHADPAENFALGWRVIDADGEVALWHEGRETGVRSLVVLFPQTGDGLVLLTNSDNGDLLARPLVAALLPRGNELNAALDRATWAYLQRMPRSEITATVSRIVSSPGLLSKLLHAVQTTQIDPSDLPAAERRRARSAIDPYLEALLDGRIDSEQPAELVSQLLAADAGGTWRRALSPGERRTWIAGLGARGVGRADRVPVILAPAVLETYVGKYRVPSSRLLIRIERHEQSLRALAEGMPPITLHAQADGRFFMREDDTRFEFIAGPLGEVDSVRLLWSGGRSEVAPRVR